MAKKDKPLTAKSSIGDWLAHPVGGVMFREMLAQSGQDEKVLAPVRLFSLQRVASMSKGMMPQELIDDMVLKANGGVAPVETDEEEEPPAPGSWVERVTAGRFEGKTVIVTGAGSGIGRATASRILREGGTVVAVDIAAERLDELAAEFGGADAGSVTTVVGDITKEEDVARIVAATNGTVHGLANVAGVMDDMTPLHEVSDAVWERVFAVNVDGMFRLTRAVLPLMLEAGYGSVVNVTSEAGLRGSAAGLAYTASKHAVVGMTKSAAFMYTLSGVRFNAVAPGPVMTNIEGNFASELGRQRLGGYMQLIPPVAEASQLASSISYLLSDDGSNISGAILPSDGGWSAA